MIAKQIQHALFGQFGQTSLMMIPNYTPNRWFECDMVRVTKARYLEEFEIKISVADFRADALKGPSARDVQWFNNLSPARAASIEFDPRSKHDRLAAGDPFGPRRFWFCLPETVAAKVDIPSWAGLITFNELASGKVRMNSLFGDQFKKAPDLHRACCPTLVTDHIRKVFYHRYWAIRQKHTETTSL